ncbi:MAG TPA: hypothetical protein VFF69_00930 [Phycisphaerales bacterium]|nr:hypothetical protein [Phycisphaerales bacterium]
MASNNGEAYRPWGISALHFPGHDAPAAERLRFLVGYAVLAPSGYNRQPWYFRIRAGVLEVFADRTRALAVVDHDDREMTISCGAAVFNLRVAARHFGYEPRVTLVPDGAKPDLLATVELGERKPPVHEDNLLFSAIPNRRTNRRPFEPRKVEPQILERLCAAAMREGAWMVALTKREERHALAELIARADRLQFSDKRFRRELAAWVHSSRSHSHDGMPAYAQGVREIMTAAHSLGLRALDLGKGVATGDLDLAEHSPLLAVLGTAEDDPAHWLRCGQALQHALLLACADGIWASFMNQPVEVETMRPHVSSLVKRSGYPQVIVRMGYGPEPPLMPRRGVAEVVRSG